MNFKLLLENFKKVLKEESINDNLALMVKGDGEELKFVLYNFRDVLESGIAPIFMSETDSIVGFIAILPSHNRHRKEAGECLGADEVKASVINSKYQGKGFGKMLYGLVMTHIYPDPLMADRASVSKSARGLWKSLEKNSKVEKVPPKKSPFIGKFDDVDEPKTKTPEDDCSVYGDSDEQVIDKAYKYGGNKSLLKLLFNKHDAMKEKMNNKRFESFLINAGEALFKEEYTHDED